MISETQLDTTAVSRRTILRSAAGFGVATIVTPLLGACGGDKARVASQGPTETPTIRIPKVALTAAIAQAVAAEFLKEEGFTEVQYVTLPRPEEIFSRFASGEFDMTLLPANMVTARVDAGDPFVALAGVNAGCFQIVASNVVKTLSDCRDKRLASSGPGFPDDIFLSLTLRNVGIDMRKENTVITHPHDAAIQALTSGDIDVMVTYPPFVSRLRTSDAAHLILDANLDRPWSQYIFSLAVVHREYLTKNPAATKRALRALLRAADVVAKEPERAAQAARAQGFIPEPLYAPTLSELSLIPYNVWRTFDPADTVRFYALRLKEAGLITGTPDQILAKGTDFRFLGELKQELKGA